MKTKNFLLTALVGGAMALPITIDAEDKPVVVVVSVTNVKHNKGKVQFALYEKDTGFPKEGQFKMKRVKAITGKTTATFIVPKGTYAVGAFHDEDGDGSLNTNFFGVPDEGFGFGNDARGTMGPPSFKDCVVKVGNGGTIEMKLEY